MTTIDTPRLDEAALEQFVNQAVGDLAAAISGLMVHLGDRLGALPGDGRDGADDADRPGRAHRHARAVRPRVAARPGRRRLRQVRRRRRDLRARCRAGARAGPEGPVFLAGAFETVASCYVDHDAIVRRVPHRRGHRLARPRRRLLTGGAAAVPARLRGQPRASPGSRRSTGWWTSCRRGRGWPTSAAASAPRRSSWRKAFERSTFLGLDYHAPSIEGARDRAAEAGVAGRTRFEVRHRRALPRLGLRPGGHVRLRCTTWATPSGRPAGSGSPWRPTAPCCSSSPGGRRAGGQPQPGRARSTTACRP